MNKVESNKTLCDYYNEIVYKINQLTEMCGNADEAIKLRDDIFDMFTVKFSEPLDDITELQEKLGCPVDVFLGLATHNITEIYIEYDDFSGNYASPYCTDEDIVVAYVAGIYDNNEINGLSKPEWKIETNMGTFPLSDYKKHFWLKKDKSE